MQVPLQVTFRHMGSSEAIGARIRGRAEELERSFERLISCRVVVECRHPRHQQGNLFHVRVDLGVPGREIVVGRDPAAHRAHEDPHVAVRDAFDAARRLLDDYVRERRSEVKLHAVPDHGRVARLIAEQDCGFIVTADGSEVYFHRNSVANGGFGKLTVGDEVRFVAQDAESARGPQASTVVPLGKHHLPPAEAVRA
ncbi:MAG TPA: HPF/RaiA family ribosome-associated protein [Stellaceae bacterium]|jgi:cold shock CspA family protein|nr:HPF/RaiA family ribosome-associated protein [Stellaceae bacterium]